MAKLMLSSSFLPILFMLLLRTQLTYQLQQSQLRAFLTIQRILNFPTSMNSLDQSSTDDICNHEPNPYLTIVCYEENITQIHTYGGVQGGVSSVSGNFSMQALISALTALPGLKVLSLVSLGLWGTIPQTIGNLTALEIINLSSNYLNSSIPSEMWTLRNLQTVVLDHNRFSGHVPAWVGSNSGLTVVSLKNNTLSGPLPSSISRLVNLRILQLSMNQFAGEVPDLSKLTNLQVLDLGINSFGPKFPAVHNKLVTLVLRKNKFRFGTFSNLSSFYQLQRFDVSYNDFVGPFPQFLMSLPLIGYLNVAGNKFHGMLQENMTCGSELHFVDLSYNLLTGDLPACLQSRDKKRIVNYRGNCLSKGDQRQHPYSVCHDEALAVKILPHKREGKGSGSKVVVAMSIVGGTSLAGLVVLGVGVIFSKHVFKKPHTTRVILEKATTAMYPSRLFADAREICQVMKLGPLGLPAYRNFHMEEIMEATSNFDKLNLIGEDAYGPVYKGRFSSDNFTAIRILKMKKRRGIQAYTQHIELLSKLRHVHLVSALGHCFECHPEDSTVNRIYLVFEFVPNGNLRDFIAGQKPTWSQRIAAAIEVAKGIQFLQTGIIPGLYANNLETTNILLDHNFHVKLNSYNLPLLAENKDMVDAGSSSTGSKGSGKAIVKEAESKCDVYEFGVILLEIIVGKAITSENDVSIAKDLFQVAVNADQRARKQVIDPAVCKESSDNSVKILMELCVRSLSSEPNDRPSIEDVLWNLEFAAQVRDSWQGGTPSGRTSPVFTSQ